MCLCVQGFEKWINLLKKKKSELNPFPLWGDEFAFAFFAFFFFILWWVMLQCHEHARKTATN